MTEYIIKNATVRIHGNCDPDRLKAATLKFLKKAEAQRKKEVKKIEARKETHKGTEEIASAMET